MNPSGNDVQALLTEHGSRLFALFIRLTLRTDVAEDLLQELFCKLATSQGFQQAKNPAGFAYRSATNLAFDWRRAKKRNPISNSSETEPLAPIHSPLADLVRREELDQTLSAIGELHTTSRDIIVLHYLQNESYETIAGQLGKTTNQIRAIAHKGVKQLREALEVEPARTSQANQIQ